ncbi:class I SAM-dependent methyltransferase [Thalassobacillus pellis]|uniref:class I SAM-dependent methyltransferase n=1 Tax=Thalassobacillus pellis TaxID=748008 RepID=UPI001961E5CA|nr:SAM-dependent methyltransferase [Thalassobacillus pellis]MBM7553049.1 putative SAM-dependent methyltransferase [Thalassobacillus pellis]
MQEQKIKLVIGAGEHNNNPGWIHTQEDEVNLLDAATWEANFKVGTIEAILAEHVWEHLTFSEGVKAARICFKYLRKGGYVRCAVPDGYFPDEKYQEIVQIGGPGPDDHPAASHKIVHNYNSISKMFEMVGFEVKLLEYCDEEGQFYTNDWDGNDGVIFRSKKFDPRNQGEELAFPSLIIDAVKR